ncbi:hypothetical protein FP828_03655 [bacterium]|nr:hypothetical protein [Candidatus Omnitrophota bacterium]MBA3065569.1 hypothetical protein [bacterium]
MEDRSGTKTKSEIKWLEEAKHNRYLSLAGEGRLHTLKWNEARKEGDRRKAESEEEMINHETDKAAARNTIKVGDTVTVDPQLTTDPYNRRGQSGTVTQLMGDKATVTYEKPHEACNGYRTRAGYYHTDALIKQEPEDEGLPTPEQDAQIAKERKAYEDTEREPERTRKEHLIHQYNHGAITTAEQKELDALEARERMDKNFKEPEDTFNGRLNKHAKPSDTQTERVKAAYETGLEHGREIAEEEAEEQRDNATIAGYEQGYEAGRKRSAIRGNKAEDGAEQEADGLIGKGITITGLDELGWCEIWWAIDAAVISRLGTMKTATHQDEVDWATNAVKQLQNAKKQIGKIAHPIGAED